MSDERNAAEPPAASGGSLAKGWLYETLERVSSEVNSWSLDKRRIMAELLPEPHRTTAITRLAEIGSGMPNMGSELGSK